MNLLSYIGKRNNHFLCPESLLFLSEFVDETSNNKNHVKIELDIDMVLPLIVDRIIGDEGEPLDEDGGM